jgi:coenzyme PQQ biosynthesis protein PqqD
MSDSVNDDWIPRFNPHFRLQWEPAQDAYVLLYPEGMIKLNFSGGEILCRCDGEKSVGQVIAELRQKFPETENIEADIKEFFATAFQRRWLTHE